MLDGNRRRLRRNQIRKCRIAVVGNQPQLLEALVDLVSEEPRLDLVGVAHDADEVLELARSRDPHVVLFDLESTGTYPTILNDLTRHDPSIRTVAWSSYDDADALRRSANAGFHRHVSKCSGAESLITVLLEEHADPA